MGSSSIAEGIKQAIYTHTYDVFEMMEFRYTADDIVVDVCNANSSGIDAIFYLKTVKKVKKDLWDDSVDWILEDRKDIMLKTIKRKDGENVRFHLKYTTDINNNPIYEPIGPPRL